MDGVLARDRARYRHRFEEPWPEASRDHRQPTHDDGRRQSTQGPGGDPSARALTRPGPRLTLERAEGDGKMSAAAMPPSGQSGIEALSS
jgi:hypothetical protein